MSKNSTPTLSEVYEIYRQKLLEATLLRMDIELATGTPCDTYIDENGNKRLSWAKDHVNAERKRSWQEYQHSLPDSVREIAFAIQEAAMVGSGEVHFLLVDGQIALHIDGKDYTLAQIVHLLRALPSVV